MTFDKRVSTPQVFRVDCPEMIADGRFEDASVDQRGDPVQQLMLFNHRRRTEHRPRKQECQVQRDRFALERHDIPRRRVMIKTTRHRTSARILRSPAPRTLSSGKISTKGRMPCKLAKARGGSLSV